MENLALGSHGSQGLWHEVKEFFNPVGEKITEGAKKASSVFKVTVLTTVSTLAKIKGDVDGLERVGQLLSYSVTAASQYVKVSGAAKTLATFGNAEQVIGFSHAFESIHFFSSKFTAFCNGSVESIDTVEKGLKEAGAWVFNLAFTAANFGGVALTLNAWNFVQLGSVAAPLLDVVGTAVGVGFFFLGAYAVVDLCYLVKNDAAAGAFVKPIATIARCIGEVAVRIFVLAGVATVSPLVLGIGISAKIIGLVPFGYDAFCEVKKKYYPQAAVQN